MCAHILYLAAAAKQIRANLIVQICLFFQCVLSRRDGETECEFQETQILVSASSCILFKQAPWLSAAPLCREAAPVMIDSMKQTLLVPHSLFFVCLLFLIHHSVGENLQCATLTQVPALISICVTRSIVFLLTSACG